MSMKAILGWLGDPFLHLLGIGLIVLAIGARMGSDPGKGDVGAADSCDLCLKIHEAAKPCARVIVSGVAPAQAR